MNFRKKIFVLFLLATSLSLYSMDLKLGFNQNTSYSSDFKDFYGDVTRGFDLALYPLKIGEKVKIGLQYSYFSENGQLPVTGRETKLSYDRLGGIVNFLILEKGRFTFFSEICGGLGRVKEKNYLGDDKKNAFYGSLGAGSDYTFLESGNVSLSSGLGIYYTFSSVEMVSIQKNRSLNYFTFNLFIKISMGRRK